MAAQSEGVGQKTWDGNFEVICDWKVLSTVGEGCDSKVVKAVHQNNGTTVCLFFVVAVVSLFVSLFFGFYFFVSIFHASFFKTFFDSPSFLTKLPPGRHQAHQHP